MKISLKQSFKLRVIFLTISCIRASKYEIIFQAFSIDETLANNIRITRDLPDRSSATQRERLPNVVVN